MIMSRELTSKEQFFIECSKSNLAAFISSTDNFFTGGCNPDEAIYDSIMLARKLTEAIFDEAGNLKERI